MYIIKSNTKLGCNLKKYVDWKYSKSRSICVMLLDEVTGCAKITTRCHKKDHYPYKLRKIYRTNTVLTEFVNIRTMLLEIRQNGL